MTTVITDENDIVKEITMIPGLGSAPKGWHVYFPVTEDLPAVGTIFKPDLEKQPWLRMLNDSSNLTTIEPVDQRVFTGLTDLDVDLDAGVRRGSLIAVRCAEQEVGVDFLLRVYNKYGVCNEPFPTENGKLPAVLFLSFDYYRSKFVRDAIIAEDRRRVERFRSNQPDPTPFVTLMMAMHGPQFRFADELVAWIEEQELFNNLNVQAIFIDRLAALQFGQAGDRIISHPAHAARELRAKVCLSKNITVFVNVEDTELRRDDISKWNEIAAKSTRTIEQVDTEISVQKDANCLRVKRNKHRLSRRNADTELHYVVGEDGELTRLEPYLKSPGFTFD